MLISPPYRPADTQRARGMPRPQRQQAAFVSPARQDGNGRLHKPSGRKYGSRSRLVRRAGRSTAGRRSQGSGLGPRQGGATLSKQKRRPPGGRPFSVRGRRRLAPPRRQGGVSAYWAG